MCEARNFTVCVDEIYGVRREIYSVKYEIKFHSAAHGDKIYGVITDDKFFGTALASVRNSGLKNACVNLRSRNTYADLKFKGDANFKFKNSANPRLLYRSNAKPLKSKNWANALSFSVAAEISALVPAGEILRYGVTTGILALALASKILIPSVASKILSSSAASHADFGPKGAGGC